MSRKRNSRADVVIAGGGIIGLATAWQMLRRYPRATIVVLEKESRVAAHQTGHNSGVIHSGIYYRPGSLKARCCVAGAAAMAAFCRDYGIPHRVCGKVIVATSDVELPALDELYRRGMANGVPAVRLLSAAELRDIEPHASGVKAIHVPGTGIVDYAAVAGKYAELFREAGGQVLTDCRLDHARENESGVALSTTCGDMGTHYLVNCTGLQADLVARRLGTNLEDQVVPFRGEYYALRPESEHLVRGLIYPVPDARFPFLGVHFTPRIQGGTEAGPNAVLALSREGYRKSDIDPVEIARLAFFPGFWRMAARYWQKGAEEVFRSFSKRAFVRQLQRLVPEITSRDLRTGGSGVRAQLLSPEGTLVDDFKFVHDRQITHVCNVPSPAATASLVIANYIVDEVAARAQLGSPHPASN